MNATFTSYKSTMASTPSGSGVSNLRVQKVGFGIKPTKPIDMAQQKQVMDKYQLPEVWEQILQDYTLVDKKGQGSYGCVMRAQCNATGQEVAIKMVKNFRKYEYEMVKVLREI